VSSTTKEPGSASLGEKAASEVGEAASAFQEKALELKEQGRNKFGESIDERTAQASRQALQVAETMRRTVTQMRNEEREPGGEQVAGILEGVANRVEQLGSYLERTRGDALLADVEDVARRRPWMVAGLGVIVGLTASRLLKASAEHRYGYRSEHPRTSLGSGYQEAYDAGTNEGYVARAH
jgi:hypothetical protein